LINKLLLNVVKVGLGYWYWQLHDALVAIIVCSFICLHFYLFLFALVGLVDGRISFPAVDAYYHVSSRRFLKTLTDDEPMT